MTGIWVFLYKFVFCSCSCFTWYIMGSSDGVLGAKSEDGTSLPQQQTREQGWKQQPACSASLPGEAKAAEQAERSAGPSHQEIDNADTGALGQPMARVSRGLVFRLMTR
jgi:hypothetical protein